MFAIYKRELKAYFQTVIGWLFIAATLCLFGLYYYVYCFAYGLPYMSAVLSAISFIFLITVPILTMRILAEDRKSKTDQLMLTAPVSVGKIVLGKFLSMVTVYCIAVAVILVSGVLLAAFGTVPMGENLSAVFGFWLYGLTCISIGMFVSSLTESQVIAAVVSFAALFLGYMMSSITGLISSGGNWLTKLLGSYDLTRNLENFFGGFFDVTGAVYYLSMTLLFLFLTVQSIQKRRWSMSGGRRVRQGFFGTGLIAAAIALVVIVNLAVGELPSTLTSFDVTRQKLFSMTDETEAALKLLDEDVTIYVLEAEENADITLDTTLRRFADSSGHITVEYKDPAISPTFYKSYTNSSNVRRNSVIVESGKRSRFINYSEIYKTETDYTTYQTTTTGYDGEGRLMSAIAYVTSDDMPVIYNIVGHGEGELDDSFRDTIEKQNITVTDLTLLTSGAVPEDAEGIIINGPQSDFSKDDAEKVINYLMGGGKAVITVGYTQQELPNFESVLEHYGVSLENGMVMDTDSSRFYRFPYYLLPEIKTHRLTSDIRDYYVFMPYTRGLTYSEELPENVAVYDILASSDSSYLKTNVEGMESYEKEDGDTDGPFKIGIEITESVPNGVSRLFVFSSDYLFTAEADSMVSGYNLKLFNSVIGEFAGDSPVSAIPVKSYEQLYIMVNQSVAVTMAVVMIVALPLVLLAAGIIIWVRRRRL